MEIVGEAPFFGYGTIQQGENEEGEIRELGADSQILFGLVSYGYPATALFFAWLLMIAIGSRQIDTPITVVTHLALVVMLIQTPFYVFLPHRLVLTMLLAGAMYRQLHQSGARRRAPILLMAAGPFQRGRRW